MKPMLLSGALTLLPESRAEGTAKEARIKVAQLAEKAQKDPAVTALFDGTK